MAMSEANVLVKMTIEKSRLIEEMIVQFLGYKPSWNERRRFSTMHKLGESSIYHKGKYIGTVRYETVDDTIT
jgi:hypothetical protein